MNTIDTLGDLVAFRKIVEKTITEFEDDTVTSIGASAFYSCEALTSVSFPKVTSIGDSAFYYCSKLTTLYIGTETDTVCTLENANAISNNVTDIYVPSTLVEQYKTATNWSKFADKIKAYTGETA